MAFYVSVMVMAVGRKVVTLVQIGDHVADAFAIDIAQQGDNLRLRSRTTSIHPIFLPIHRTQTKERHI